MNKLYRLIFLSFFIAATTAMMAQDEDCNTFDLLPPIEMFQMSNDNPPVPCGFQAGSLYVNECSPCGRKISDNNCTDAPNPTICELDGFETTTSGFDNDVFAPTLGFCGGGTGTHNNFWIGFTAQTNIIELLITTSDCANQGNARGIQIAIAETDCDQNYTTLNGDNPCFGAVGQGGLFNNSTIISANNLVPGNPYYILVDGFAGGVCELRIDVLDGFGVPEYDTAVNDPGQLCPDVLNPGEFTPQFGSGAIVDVQVGGIATTDLTYFWLNPSDEVIATTQGEVITPNFVRGTLDGSFFNETGTYSVQIIDNGSCCPLCTEVELTIADPPPAAAAVIAGANGATEFNCNTDEILIEGGPLDGSTPAVEQWQIVDSNGDRQQIDVHLVSQDGRLDQIILTREQIEEALPGQTNGTVTIVYGFLTSFTDLCFADAGVEIEFDFREPEIDIDNPDMLDCLNNPSVTIDASDTNTFGHNSTFVWEAADGVSSIANADTDMPTVTNNGTYNVTVTDTENGCTAEASVDVLGMVDPPVLTAIEDITLDCNTTSMDASSTGTANDPINYSWDRDGTDLGINVPDLTNITEAGTYTLTAINSVNSCQAATSFNVTVLMPNISISEVRDSVLDCNVSEVTFEAAVPTGANGPYTYSWVDSDGNVVSTDAVLTADAADTYTLTVTDMESGCTMEQETILGMDMESPVLGMLPDDLVIDCNTSMVNAIATATDANGDPIANLEYEWTEMDGTVIVSTPDVMFDADGTYTVLVTNPANGCTSEETLVVDIDTAEPDASIDEPADLTCATTSVMLQGSSMNTETLSYQWYEGADDTGTALGAAADQEVGNAGTYSLVITNTENGCTTLETIIVEENMVDPTPDAGMPQVLTCLNMDDGVMLDGSSSSGIGTLSYEWTLPGGGSAGTDAMINGMVEGEYTLIITDDANGCTAMSTVMVTTDQAPPENVTVNSGTLPCGQDEFVLEAMTSTTGNLDFIWTDQGMNTYPNGQTLTVTSGGTYTVTVVNLDNGCETPATGMVMPDQDAPNVQAVLISGDLAPIDCNNPVLTYEGQLMMNNPDVTLVWTDPNGNEITGNQITLDEFSVQGQYTVTATDNVNMCTATGTVSPLWDFATPEIELTSGTIFCEPNNTVTLTAIDPTVNSGTSFTWTDPNGMPLTEGLSNPNVSAGGMYSVVATGDNGCTSTSQIMVDVNNDEPTIAVGPDFSLSCRPGEDTYALGGSGAAANGSDPVTFSWTLNGMEVSTDPNYVVSDPGNYVLTVTNMLTNCTTSEMVQVDDIRTMPIAIAQVQEQLNCVTPMVMLEGDSDDPNADYQWTSENGTVVMGQTPMVSEEGIWELLVTSANGCTMTAMTEVFGDFEAPQNLMITGDSELTCQVNSIQLFGSTSSMNATNFAWTLDGGTDVVSDQQNPNFGAPGVYTLTITGDNGCVASTDFEITSDDNLPTPGATVERTITCEDGSTMIFGTSSAVNTNYSWTGPPGFAPVDAQDIETTIPGEYILTIVDTDNDCDASFTIVVLEDRERPVVMTEGSTVVCDPAVVSSVNATSDVMNASYLWEGPNGFSSMEANPVITEAGTYSVTVTNLDNGCTTVEETDAEEGRDLPEDIEAMADVELLTCDEPMSTLLASSSTTGVVYTWNGPGVNNEDSDAIMVDAPGTYTVNFLDPTNGCETERVIEITEDFTEPMPVGDTPDQLNCQITEVALVINTNEDIRTYEWEGPNPGDVSDPSAASPLATAPGTYSVTVTAADNGCTAVETITVAIDQDIPVSVPTGSEITCANQEITLDGSASTPPAGNISYLWTGPGGFTSTELNTTTTIPGEYTLTVSNSDNLCDISETVMITEDILEPTADAGMDDVFACADAFVTLSAAASSGQGTLSFVWTNDNGTVVGTDETIDVVESGVFTVQVMDSDNGCTSTANVTITPDENKPAVAIASPETLTCAVQSVELNASATTGIGNLDYMWTFNGTAIGTDPVITVNTPGTYTLLVVDGSNGCDQTESIEVMLDEVEPSFDITSSDLDCLTGSTDVRLSNIVATNPSYSWTTPDGSNPTTQDLLGVTAPGTYTVVVMDGDNGCTFERSTVINLDSNAPTATIAAPEMLDCDTEVIQLVGNSTGTNLSFSWSGPNVISGGNTLTPTVGEPGTYELNVTDPSNGCNTLVTIDVLENENIITAINPAGDDVNCFGPNTGSIAIGSSQVTGGEAPYLYSIDGGDSFSTQEDFLGLTAGTYDVVVMDINGCLEETTIVINPAEELVLDLGENQVIAFGDSIMLNPVANFNIDVANWSDTLLMGTTPFVTPLSTTTYEIDAFDEDGCPITDQITIFVEKTRPVYIPSAFSPNGDGTNDVFTVYADLDLIESIKNLSVYDRWGEQMFFMEELTPAEALQEINGWNGQYRTEDMNPGVYVYHVTVEFIDGEEIFYEGDVTLFR